MNELDRKIREALAADEAEMLGPLGEPPLSEQVLETFRGRERWLMVLTFIAISVYAVFTIVSIIFFFRAESVREMIAWAGGFGLGLTAVTSGKIWYWMQLHRNAVLREVKRVELQIARLASQVKKPGD